MNIEPANSIALLRWTKVNPQKESPGIEYQHKQKVIYLVYWEGRTNDTRQMLEFVFLIQNNSIKWDDARLLLTSLCDIRVLWAGNLSCKSVGGSIKQTKFMLFRWLLENKITHVLFSVLLFRI